jgi:hypothetical protein
LLACRSQTPRTTPPSPCPIKSSKLFACCGCIDAGVELYIHCDLHAETLHPEIPRTAHYNHNHNHNHKRHSFLSWAGLAGCLRGMFMVCAPIPLTASLEPLLLILHYCIRRVKRQFIIPCPMDTKAFLGNVTNPPPRPRLRLSPPGPLLKIARSAAGRPPYSRLG